MSHWIVAPIVLPAAVAALLVLLPRRLALQRAIGVATTFLLFAIAIALAVEASSGGIRSYALGDWPAPYGIVLVVDRLAALMLVLTAIVALGSVLAAVEGFDEKGPHFHVLFQFQLMGINGAFLTGDLFNLFVFFEVLLIASYGLLLHGGGARRHGAGLHYVVINLTGSALFLVAVSLLYAVTGTLNMADLAAKVARVPATDAGLVRAAGLLLFVVFAVKAALVPLHLWLPGAYRAAGAPVAALFAIMTKVGVYAVVRTATLVFGPDAGEAASLAAPWLLPLGLATLVAGTLGAFAATSLRGLVAYFTVASIGTIFAGAGTFAAVGLAAALYYAAHSTVVVALMFLLAGAIAEGRGELDDRLERGVPVPRPALIGGLFFVGAIALAGVPPLSGFLGKAMILQAALGIAATPWVWTAVLATALLGLVALAHAGSRLFWNVDSGPEGRDPSAGRARAAATTGPGSDSTRAEGGALLPAGLMLGALGALTVLADPVSRYTAATAEQLLRPAAYVSAVLGGPATPAAPGGGPR